MLLVYMICTGMCWNGAKMFGTIAIIVLLPTNGSGKLGEKVIEDCSVVVAGSTILGIAGVQDASMTVPTPATTMWVLGFCCLCRWFLASVPRILFHNLIRVFPSI